MREICTQFLTAREKMLTSDVATSEYQTANFEMWSAMLEAVHLHRSRGGVIPPEMAFELETELETWLAGIPSERLPLLTSRGRKTSPIIRNCKLHAVMYLAASSSVSRDQTPRKTLRKYFGIVESALQEWKNEFFKEAQKSLAKFHTELPEGPRGRMITALAMSSGRHYQALKKRPKPKRSRR